MKKCLRILIYLGYEQKTIPKKMKEFTITHIEHNRFDGKFTEERIFKRKNYSRPF
jgi:hypothetical protein